MTDRRKFILEALGAIIVIALLIALLLWFRNREVEETPDTPSVEDIRSMPRTEEVFDEQTRQNTRPAPEVNARIFTERFGSFSSQSDFNNLRDIYPIITPELRIRLEALAAAGANEIREQYFGVSTRVISLETLEATESTARLNITTQRTEASGSVTNQQVRYQDIIIFMVNVDGNWLIADYEWQNN